MLDKFGKIFHTTSSAPSVLWVADMRQDGPVRISLHIRADKDPTPRAWTTPAGGIQKVEPGLTMCLYLFFLLK